MISLTSFGWTTDTQTAWDGVTNDTLQPARVIADFGTSLKVVTPETITAELSGTLAHYSQPEATPKVGDWVSIRPSSFGTATVESVFYRKNEIARKTAGKRTVKQIIAANVDIAFVLLALDADFSIERLKRFLFQLSVDAIEPIIVLNKADKTDDVESYRSQLADLHIPIITAIAKEGVGVAEVAARILPGKTAILLGSSGVGKSTLTNKLLGREAQATKEVRASDDTGRHTTVHRELFVLENGGLLIDTPGIRELQLWGTDAVIDQNFDDIIQLAAQCQYANCRHTSEKGCAVTAALKNGTLDRQHYGNYRKMRAEIAQLSEKQIVKARYENRRPRARPTDDD
jgi:ribosome biogenesis GTPase